MTMKVEEEAKLDIAELDGKLLDYYVARAKGLKTMISGVMNSCMVSVNRRGKEQWIKYNPSTTWTHGGPLIELEGITIEFQGELSCQTFWAAYSGFEPASMNTSTCYAPTPLVAAMRVVVKKHFGKQIDLTQEI